MAGKTIAVAIEKGGSGKTTNAVQLAQTLADMGYKVCLIDNDSSGDCTKAIFGTYSPSEIELGLREGGTANTVRMYHEDVEFDPIEISENLFFMGAGLTDALKVDGIDLKPVWTFNDNVRELEEVFDLVIIDCPPSFNLLYTAAMRASATGGILIPFEPEDFGFHAALKIHARKEEMNRQFNVNIKTIGFLACKFKVNPLSDISKHYIEEMKNEFPKLLFKAQRHDAVKVSEAIAVQEKLTEYAPVSSKAVRQLLEFTEEFIERLGI